MKRIELINWVLENMKNANVQIYELMNQAERNYFKNQSVA